MGNIYVSAKHKPFGEEDFDIIRLEVKGTSGAQLLVIKKTENLACTLTY